VAKNEINSLLPSGGSYCCYTWTDKLLLRYGGKCCCYAWNDKLRPGRIGQLGQTGKNQTQWVWLENWFPTPILDPKRRLDMTFFHAECWDIRARARKLQQHLKWEEKGAVFERWVETCAMVREPSRLALGRYIRKYWLRELERQKAIKQSKPGIAG
jgi:hypothetical protein